MASNDSGVDTSTDSNDTSLSFPLRFKQRSILEYKTNQELLPAPTTVSQSLLGKQKSNNFKLKLKFRHPPYIRTYPNERKLRLAASVSNVELLIRLLESGIDPNCADDYQRSSLHLAASRGYADVVIQLLKYGAKPNLKDSLGNTPLHLAVCSASSFNFHIVVRILVKSGASVYCTDRAGKNPLDLARSKLSLMRNRRIHEPSPESAKMLSEMSSLTTFLLKKYLLERKELQDISILEEQLQNLSTKEADDEADMLLAKVDQLTLNKN